MDHPQDIEGMIQGLDVMYRNTEDTKIIVYLCTNSTAGNNLSLKHAAFEFAGNYAKEDINDITRIDIKELLEYNLVDCLSTMHVYNKFISVLKEEDQEDIYRNLFLPALRNITNMELVGMPMDMATIDKLDKELEHIHNTNLQVVRDSKIIKDYELNLQWKAFKAANLKLKKKIRPLDDFVQEFNPGSGTQLAGLLFDHLGFEVIETTDSGSPATGKKVLKRLYKQLLNDLNLTDEDIG